MVGGAVLALYIYIIKYVFKKMGGEMVEKEENIRETYMREKYHRYITKGGAKFTKVLRMHVYVLGRHATNTMDDSMWLDALCCEAQLMQGEDHSAQEKRIYNYLPSIERRVPVWEPVSALTACACKPLVTWPVPGAPLDGWRGSIGSIYTI